LGNIFTYTVKTPIHRGKLYGIGSDIDLTAPEAAKLADMLDLESKRPAVDAVDDKPDVVFIEKIQKLEAQIETLQGENTTLQSTVDNRNSQLAERASDLDEITAELTTLRNEKAGLETDLTNIKTLLTTAQDNNKKLAGQVDQLKKALAKKK